MTARDRSIDTLRAAAIVGVVLGHWLVSAIVADPVEPTALHGASALGAHPVLVPASWLLQMLGPFFFAGGFAAAVKRSGSRSGGGPRLSRLKPVLVVAAVWVPAMLLLYGVGAPVSTQRLILSLVTHPFWFLIAYLLLSFAAPYLRRAVVRGGAWIVLPMIAFVGLVDLLRPQHLRWLELLAVPIGWAVPYVLGMALALGRLPRHAGGFLATGGVLGGAALVLFAGYPASAVGVPGDRFSNLDPPSLFTMALAAAQIGVFLLIRSRLSGPRIDRPVRALNGAAMTVYCWHQTALLLVTFAGLLFGRLPGLLDEPDTLAWIAIRCAWLAVFALALLLLVRVFHRFEAPAGSRPTRTSATDEPPSYTPSRSA
jgi:fucose 4-O-acetylase-like acetyltransferase